MIIKCYNELSKLKSVDDCVRITIKGLPTDVLNNLSSDILRKRYITIKGDLFIGTIRNVALTLKESGWSFKRLLSLGPIIINGNSNDAPTQIELDEIPFWMLHKPKQMENTFLTDFEKSNPRKPTTNKPHKYVNHLHKSQSYWDTLRYDEKQKIKRARFWADRKADERWNYEHRHGYCPYCHMLKTTEGKCPNGCDD